MQGEIGVGVERQNISRSGITRRALITTAALAIPTVILADSAIAQAADEKPELVEWRWDKEFNEGQAVVRLPRGRGPDLDVRDIVYDNGLMQTDYLYYLDYGSERQLIQVYVTGTAGTLPASFSATLTVPGYAPVAIRFID